MRDELRNNMKKLAFILGSITFCILLYAIYKLVWKSN